MSKNFMGLQDIISRDSKRFLELVKDFKSMNLKSVEKSHKTKNITRDFKESRKIP